MTCTSSILAPALGPIPRLAGPGRRLRVTGQGWRPPTTDFCCGAALLIPVTILVCDVSHFTSFSGVVGCILRIDARACMRRREWARIHLRSSVALLDDDLLTNGVDEDDVIYCCCRTAAVMLMSKFLSDGAVPTQNIKSKADVR